MSPLRRYTQSEQYLARAERVIPLGSQTFSKSRTQYPFGVSPYFIRRGQGSRVWDIDGNEYIDFVNSLASVTLGYNDPDVTQAVRAQLDDGVIFSLPHPVEAEVAELICEMVPCAEMVRFGKNGSDATSGAIRLARAFTSRDRVAVCGYHGWQDWYIGSTARHRGVPQATRELTQSFAYNDLPSLQRLLDEHPAGFAAVIVEPMNTTAPAAGFLEGVKRLAHSHGALLVFDETITGFRYANGGAQELFGVTPDLATFGKGLANGYPVSAVAGRREVMKLMEEIFFSFTFGGEALSLAAAKATLLKLQREPVVRTLAERGHALLEASAQLIARSELGDIFSVSGHPSWSFLNIRDARGATAFEIKALWIQEMLQRGVLSVGTHNLSYAHTAADVARLLEVYAEVLPMIGRVLDAGTLGQSLRCEPLAPLFKVR
jgi:glutamate-1-semialdehyde 2,1-aminomutase